MLAMQEQLPQQQAQLALGYTKPPLPTEERQPTTSEEARTNLHQSHLSRPLALIWDGLAVESYKNLTHRLINGDQLVVDLKTSPINSNQESLQTQSKTDKLSRLLTPATVIVKSLPHLRIRTLFLVPRSPQARILQFRTRSRPRQLLRKRRRSRLVSINRVSALSAANAGMALITHLQFTRSCRRSITILAVCFIAMVSRRRGGRMHLPNRLMSGAMGRLYVWVWEMWSLSGMRLRMGKIMSGGRESGVKEGGRAVVLVLEQRSMMAPSKKRRRLSDRPCT
jgi:hypothetical protein